MSEKKASVAVETTGPRYVGWRGELLAEVAVAGLSDVVVTNLASNGHVDLGEDFVVVAPQGLCFFVQVKAFSSLDLKINNVASIPELRFPVDARLVRAARQSRTPVILFLFDADTDHGRYLRLDTLPEPEPNRSQVTVRLP